MPSVTKERTLTGNRCVLRMSAAAGNRVLGVGVVGNVGPIQDMSGNTDLGVQDVAELGTANRVELVLGLVRHSVTINTLRLNKQDSGFDPREIIQNSNDLVIDVVDRKNNELLESFRDCMIASDSISIPRNALLTKSMRFEALTREKVVVD